MSTENQNIPPNTETPGATKGAAAAPTSSLLTPNATPEVEDDVDKATTPQSDAAATHRREVSAEIQRILGCADDSYAEIMGVKTDATAKEKEAAWRRLGCLLHEKSTNEKDAEKAFNMAAKSPEIDEFDIEEMLDWDGKEPLPDLEEDSMDVDPIPVPPQTVRDIFDKATPSLDRLKENSDDPAALKEIATFNMLISEFALAQKEVLGDDASDVSSDTWSISVPFFGPHYRLVRDNYQILVNERTNKSARRAIAKTKRLIDEYIEWHHFPQNWTVETADTYLERQDKGGKEAEGARLPGSLAAIRYPWTTAPAADGSLIIGVRKQGRFGNQILTVSSFSKVLGRSSARAEIEKVCRRDDIAPPWDAGYISEYHDPSRLEKNPVHRRALQKAQAESSAKKRLDERKQDLDEAAGKTDRTPKELDDRVGLLEVSMTEMKTLLLVLQENMNILVASIQAPVQPK
ncbi:uncharacterized protein CLUP02_01844 [Colletotrichum lupini]|uniref:Uncharacterized protein n=1 Tax=Colletotrichum lupini TaxID=145971 RepID=A0A9Q8SDY6_9PEZI|nr:uncharacterized protein CLUP02_01844 [Colletotrichum lupini]UQC75191.1 hypothetical protein CLUP02_01844 [Colletotrichum lupini]